MDGLQTVILRFPLDAASVETHRSRVVLECVRAGFCWWGILSVELERGIYAVT